MRLLRLALCAALIVMAPLAKADARWAHRGHGHRGRSAPLRTPRFACMLDAISPLDSCPYRRLRRRSAAARAAFERENPCPSTGRPSGACPGYVVDHIIALKRGGADAPSNMQWQTIEDAKAKDRVE